MARKCLENLHKCKAACCRWVALPIDPGQYWLGKDYWDLHGMRLLRDDLLLVPCRCQALQADNTCKLHPNGKPKPCREGYTGNEKSLIWFGSCAYINERPDDAIVVGDL